ncbi:substrate-binding domain-containing protein [Duffyella gerundensis]|uniref:LacI family DNA-binding transcriptional regulator n=1 Tax=Duffyella gerundensis TaxID=1619313 RepID=UPI001AE4925C|nr:LacI family DNA-binding transcriptional regulator [Duffyella gerundensis]QTO55386.1 substrate-binding domain-containing protein [Duffyella gerundensis]
MASRSVTLDDVARAAGVSYQTVSRVLNRSQQVAPDTRQRVEAAMRQLNYVPNRVAQQLAGKTRRTIGLATSDLVLQAPAQIASAIQHEASAQGYQLVIAMADAPGVDAARAAVNELLAQRVDGLLLNLPLHTADACELSELLATLPALFMDVAADAPVAQCVCSAEWGARLGAEHLLALGHRRIALLNGPASSVAAKQRFDIWQQVLAEHQLQPHSVLEGDWSARAGYQAMLTLLPDNLPDALLTANDQMALGALRALHQHGVRVPADVSVVGYDDTAESAWYQPPLTTVRQDLRQLGQQSVLQLVANIEQRSWQAPPLTTELVIRETTARAGIADEEKEIADELARLAQRLRARKPRHE